MTTTPSSPSAAASRRLKLWELPGGFHCSIVGTCLPHAMLVGSLRRLKMRPGDDAEDYEVHGFFVHNAGTDGPVARLLQKLLDARAFGEIRRFGRATTADQLSALWDQARADGRVDRAYWALMSHPATPSALRDRAHGHVHMLAHAGTVVNREQITRRQAAERQCQAMTVAYERLQRTTAAKIESLRQTLTRAEAEAAARLRQASAASRTPMPAVTATPPETVPERGGDDRKLAARLARTERRLAAERERARAAEAEAARLRAQLDGVCASASGDPGPEAPASPPREILYLGGISRTVSQLAAAAERFDATLVHHDGGVDDSPHALDALVERCDMVCCPVDCINHVACRRAKQLCKRHQKPFVPLRSCGAASFFNALRANRAH